MHGGHSQFGSIVSQSGSIVVIGASSGLDRWVATAAVRRERANGAAVPDGGPRLVTATGA